MAVEVDRVTADAERFERDGHVRVAQTRPATSLATYLTWAAIFVVIAAFNELAVEEMRAGRGAVTGRENGPLEFAQLCAMVPALALFAAAWRKSRGAVGVAAAFLAAMGTIAVVRELDFKALDGAYGGLQWYWSHGVQESLLAGLALATVLYLFQKRRYFRKLVRLGARWQAWPCALSLMLLATAELYLDGFTGPVGHFWEELVETNGYFLFAVAAWRHAALIGDPVLDQPL